MDQRNKVIPAVYLFLERKNQVLLLRRYQTGYRDGEYGLISGHVEAGEALRQAIIREAREEAGINITATDLALAHIISTKSDLDASERVEFFWRCSKWAGEITNSEPEKCDDLSWFDKDNLPDNIVPAVKLAWEEIQHQRPYSELGWSLTR